MVNSLLCNTSAQERRSSIDSSFTAQLSISNNLFSTPTCEQIRDVGISSRLLCRQPSCLFPFCLGAKLLSYPETLHTSTPAITTKHTIAEISIHSHGQTSKYSQSNIWRNKGEILELEPISDLNNNDKALHKLCMYHWKVDTVHNYKVF